MPSSSQTITLHLHQQNSKYHHEVDVIEERSMLVWEFSRDAMPIKGCFQNIPRARKKLLLKSIWIQVCADLLHEPKMWANGNSHSERLCWFYFFRDSLMLHQSVYTFNIVSGQEMLLACCLAVGSHLLCCFEHIHKTPKYRKNLFWLFLSFLLR